MLAYSIRYLLLLALFFAGIQVQSQSGSITLNGRVTDKESGLALQGISVYVNNTGYSTQTGKDGYFHLPDITLARFDLVFSAINYETQTVSIDARDSLSSMVIRLQKNTATLNEVVVRATADGGGWTTYGSTFFRDFLSYSAFAKKCNILNNEVISFRKLKTKNLLRAYATAPLKIRNEALGYDITYWLDAYEHQFVSGVVSYKGNAIFTEMKGNSRKTRYWNNNREKAYRGSLTHFISAAYNGNTAEEGFTVNLIKEIAYKDISLYLPAFTDTTGLHSLSSLAGFITTLYNSEDSSLAAENARQAATWLTDTRNLMPLVISRPSASGNTRAYFFVKKSLTHHQVFVYGFDVSDAAVIKNIQWETAGTIIPDQKMLNRINGLENLSPQQRGQLRLKLFYSRPINPERHITRRADKAFLQFSDTWQVTYTREKKDKEYIEENSLQNSDSGQQESTLHMRGSQPVSLYPNGYYTGTYSLVTGAYWSYEKVDKMLPLDFNPSK